jgi:hypothetical protein
MDAQPKKPVTTTFREWTQFLLLLFAAAWGVYTFIYKEITAPKAAPINISLEVQARRVGADNIRGRQQKEQLIAIELKVVAKNPSSRTVYLLRPIWFASAGNIEARTTNNDESLDDEIVKSLNSGQKMVMERHTLLLNAKIVAAGVLFVDDLVRPGEAISRTVIFHIPKELYDHVTIFTEIPTAGTEGIDIEWQYDSTTVEFTRKLYRTDASSQRQEIPEDRLLVDKTLEIQSAESSAELSLWRLE